MTKEIQTPFQINAAGGIAFVSDPVEQAMQHIQAAVMTGPGERVMRPAYGVALYQSVFDDMDPVLGAGLAADMQMKINAFVPEVVLVNISSDVTGAYNETMLFTISFRLVGSEETHVATISVGGTVSERTFTT